VLTGLQLSSTGLYTSRSIEQLLATASRPQRLSTVDDYRSAVWRAGLVSLPVLWRVGYSPCALGGGT
jgi:hypothetical protein